MPWVQKSLAFQRKAGRSNVLFIGGFAMNRARESFTTRSIASPGRCTLLIQMIE